MHIKIIWGPKCGISKSIGTIGVNTTINYETLKRRVINIYGQSRINATYINYSSYYLLV